MKQEPILETVPDDDHVVVARRDPGVPRLEQAPRSALLDADRRLGRQTFGQQPGEHGGHVLDDHDGHREVRRQPREDFGQGVRSPGRGSDGQHPDRASPGGGGLPRGQAAGPCAGRCQLLAQGGAEGLDRGDQLLPDDPQRTFQAPLVGGLGEVIGRPERQGVEGRLRPAFRQGAEHDHRQPRVRLAQLLERLQAVHLRHRDVEDDQVRAQLGQLGQGDPAVGGGADHFQLGVAGKFLGHHAAVDDGVIDDQDADLGHALLPEDVQQAELRDQDILVKGFHDVLVGAGVHARETCSLSVSVVTMTMRSPS